MTDTGHAEAHRNELAAAADEKTVRRAKWEHLRLAACPGAKRVNVANLSWGVAAVRTGEHTYAVTIAPDGQPESCACPADEYQPGPCKHAVKVADAPDVIAEAMHGGSDPEPARGADAVRAVADGGQPTGAGIDETEADGETCDDCGLPLADAHDQPAGYTETLTDGSEICGACADIRHDRYRGERKTADELAEQDSDGERGTVDAHGCSTCDGYAYGDDDQCTECQQRGVSPVDEAPL